MREAEPYGVWMWFDPHRESVKLYDAPSLVRVLAPAQAKPVAALDKGQHELYLDRVVSVSAPTDTDTPAPRDEFDATRDPLEELPF